MDKTLIPGLISSVVAISAAAIAVWGQLRVKRVEARLELQKAEAGRRAETEQTARRFREPLGRSAYELQSRIYNIVIGNFFKVYLEGGDDRARYYAINHTLFVIAQYFAWTELIRREIQFIDLGADQETRELAQLQHKIYASWQTDRYFPLLRVFGGEQHAIGERMIWEGPRGPQCMGFATFLDYLMGNPDPLICALKSDVEALGAHLEDALPRLTELQHSLVDLVMFLDPEAIRFPKKNRTKIDS
ncbi:MAG TPA: hypothetical protein VF865_05315 [Acidobacteriaceae bacterium]